MRMKLAVLAFCLGVGDAAAGSPLQGRWDITMPGHPEYSGELVIDGEGRALFSGAVVGRPTMSSRGYISRLTDTSADIMLTDGKAVGRVRCAIQSVHVLNCDDVGQNGVSQMYYLRRIGAGPASLH